MSSPFRCAVRAGLVAPLAVMLGLSGCGRTERPAGGTGGVARPAVPPVAWDTGFLRSVAIGAPLAEMDKPWVAHVTTVDLDRDGRLDVLACEARANVVVWLRQTAPGEFAETVLTRDIAAPVHVEAVDFDADGDLDLLVASMGQVFPNNDKLGSVVVLENDGAQRFTRHVVLERVARVTDVRAGDFNRDGRLDLAVALFGYDQGEVRVLENQGGWQFRSQILLDLSGAINVCVGDLNGDRFLDVVTVVSQQWEEIHLFTGDGAGGFTGKVIFGSTEEDFGSSGITLVDLNRDGRLDVLATNGDGFDYADPGARPWHGVQWLENRGDGFFRVQRIGDLAGAYSPVALDLDGDGALEIVAVSGFNNWSDPAAESMVAWRATDAAMTHFTRHVLARTPTHLMAATAGDLDDDGRAELVTGGFHAYPPWDRMSRVRVWRSAAEAAGAPPLEGSDAETSTP